MIRSVMVINTQGKPRLAKFYNNMQELIYNVYGVLCSKPENVSNFVEAKSFFGPVSQLLSIHFNFPYLAGNSPYIYKHFVTLYFVFVSPGLEHICICGTKIKCVGLFVIILDDICSPRILLLSFSPVWFSILEDNISLLKKWWGSGER
ncbi:hypothetical protein UlMin_001144 [Ulmus minor]